MHPTSPQTAPDTTSVTPAATRTTTHTATTWTTGDPRAAGVRLVHLPTPAVDALAAGDLDRARELSGLDLPDAFVTGRSRWVWQHRSEQLATAPDDALWVTRAVLDPDGTVVGRAGFHGRPDTDGMVEVGYETVPDQRRRGHARAALLVLLSVARAEPRVRTLRASISPDNVASRTLVTEHGLVVTGEQWDDEDGLETVYEVSVQRQ